MSSRITRSQSRNQNQPNQLQIQGSSINECGIFNIIETKYDGDCLFTSILNYTGQNKEYFMSAPQVANKIRSSTVEYILSKNAIGFQQNWDRFYENIKFNLETGIVGLSDYGDNDEKDALIKLSYRDYMMKAGNFGTFSELCASAELYRFHGYIFQRGETNEFTCYEFGTNDNPASYLSKPPLYLLFTGSIDSGHFRRLEPSSAPSRIQAGKYLLMDQSPQTLNESKITIRKVQGKSTTNSGSTKTNRNLNVPPPSKNINKNSNVVNPATETNQDLKVPEGPPVQTFTCDVCKLSFPTKRGLNVHRNRHVKEANVTTAGQLKERLGSKKRETTALAQPVNEKDQTVNDTTKEPLPQLESDCKKWEDIFNNHENSEAFDESLFDKDVTAFLEFIFKSNEKLPGPKHPAIKFYRLRQKKKMRP